MQGTNNLFHASCVPLETMQILSEAFPDVADNKGVIRGENVKLFILYMLITLRNYANIFLFQYPISSFDERIGRN
jgi:hypothetical protein